MNLRHATLDDIEAGIDLGRRMHEESEFAFLPFDADKVRRLLHHIADNLDRYCAYVVEHDDCLVGLLVGQVMEYFFCRERLSDDMLLFVEQNQRGSIAALKLMHAYLDWSRDQGVREARVAISTGIDTDKTGAFLERLGFRHVGGVYKHRMEQ